ncbi:MAG: hypothetical protein CVV32_03290 [Methanomicrobiales archaeon HGW-Methanomicrobiales-3]|jgi:hypothetical protein|nr:MAG: hypothetical protein CVV32_03290 [Methanomicrobiales archaeon HGW-Methanomicrobiales-3]
MTNNDETQDIREEGKKTAASRTVTQEDQNIPGGEGVAKKTASPPRLVERKTELRGQGIAARREPKSTMRRRTERDLSSSDPEIPYAKTERAVRDLVCSLLERQDRMNEAIFLKLNDLGYRLDDVEEDMQNLREGRGQR